MKTTNKQGYRQFQLKILAYGNSYYIERIEKLEAALARKPRCLELDMIGVGEIPADLSLLIRSVLLGRSPKTRLITRARSSLQGGSVLLWLQGDERVIRDDARVFFRRPESPEEEGETEKRPVWKDSELKYMDSYTEIDPEECDYVRVLELINQYLPVKELAGRIIGAPVLRQFGLVENEKLDQFLARVFAKQPEPADEPAGGLKETRRRGKARAAPTGQEKK